MGAKRTHQGKTYSFLAFFVMRETEYISGSPAARCELIVGFRGLSATAKQVRPHTHPFWQFEIIVQGRTTAQAPPKAIELAPGDCLLIPPGLLHGFIKRTSPFRWATFRFTATGVRPPDHARKLEGTPFNLAVRDALLDAMPRSLSAPTSPDGRAAASLLAALLERNTLHDALDGPGMADSRLVREVRAFVRRYATQRVFIEDIAGHCGYSPKYFAKKFRRETGHVLKQFVDGVRCRMAQDLLAHSDLRVGEIARDVGFDDIYGFSRFFKRVTGRSPRAYRAGVPHET